jgi:UDP-3-O-[3-hydroxymyristoyl] N-acetylglucosamine deacetylase
VLQATVKSEMTFEGVGIHNGVACRLSLLPAPEDHGIVYAVDDSDEIMKPFPNGVLRANYANVSDATMCTRLGFNGVEVSVVEHLSAALYACGISNAIIRVRGGEVPILDGSAMEFVKKILATGVEWQKKSRKKLKILKTVKVEEDGKWAAFSPSDAFILHMTCDFSSKGLITQPFLHKFSPEKFMAEVAPARTFGFLMDQEFYRKHGLALGASPENTVVFDLEGHPMTKAQIAELLGSPIPDEASDNLRFPDEPVRHKILDAIGDLSLAEYEIVGRYDGFCSGHRLNNLVLRKLFANRSNFLIV